MADASVRNKTTDEELGGSHDDAWRKGIDCPHGVPCLKSSASDSIPNANSSSEEGLKKAAEEGPEAAFIFCIFFFWPFCI